MALSFLQRLLRLVHCVLADCSKSSLFREFYIYIYIYIFCFFLCVYFVWMCLFLATRNTFDLMHIFMFFFYLLLCTTSIRLSYFYVDSMPRFTCYCVKNISECFIYTKYYFFAKQPEINVFELHANYLSFATKVILFTNQVAQGTILSSTYLIQTG